MKYDESAGINSLDIGVRVDGKNGEFLGVVKGVVNIKDVESVIQGLKENSEYKTMDVTFPLAPVDLSPPRLQGSVLTWWLAFSQVGFYQLICVSFLGAPNTLTT